MKKLLPQLSSDELRLLFARLNPLDVEQFYTAYSLWSTQQRIQALQTQIGSLHQDITANMEQQNLLHPSALALDTLARLQSKGISDITILDRMLDRGDVWLDHTMQHLEYCERLNVLRNDYTTWCEHALEGAYDWIDSIQGTENPPLLPSTSPTLQEFTEPTEESIEQHDTYENSEPASEIIEALFLQKLMSDGTENAATSEVTEDTEDTAFMLDITLKIPAIPKPTAGASLPLATTVQPAPSEHYTPATEQETGPEDVDTTPVLIETQIWQSETYPEAVETTPTLIETQIWQSETYPEAVEATPALEEIISLPQETTLESDVTSPMLEETPIEQAILAMTVIEQPQELQVLQTEPQQSPEQPDRSIETQELFQAQEDAQEPVNAQGPAFSDVNAQEALAQSQEHSTTIQDQYNSNPIASLTSQTPSVVSPSVPSFDTIYSVDQVEAANWAAAVASERGSSVQVEHKNTPPKRNKGFWRTMRAFLFHK